ncbi:MAG TPA: hypothetical protein VN628_15250 [Vicinamibacterales bacterium]|nr:hypothetical protein [Vicinamibacterales bacterium]
MLRFLSWLAFAAMAVAQSSSGLGGIWSLNRSASQFPPDLGFSIDTGGAIEPGEQPAQSGGRGRRGSSGGRASGTPFGTQRESYEDAQKRKLVTDEARNPPSRLTIIDDASVVVITNELGQTRMLHPNAREESVDIQGIPVPVTTLRDGTKLVVVYHVEQNRDVRFTYSASGAPARMTVDTEFLDHGNGDKVTRVYDAGLQPVVAAAAPAASAPGAPGSVPASSSRESFDQRPGAEFRGLKDVGILVEDLGPDATACGLKRDAIEDTLAKKLSAGGLNVRRNSDEDTYLYVNIITNSTPTGTCTTRYDAFLYTHATAKLSYREQPVLVQVSLMHRGGIGTSGIASHAAAVSRGLETYVDTFLTQIRDANK